MEATTDQTLDADQPAGEWVLLEIFGHRRHFGFLTEIGRFGSKLARIDEYRPGEDTPAATHYYGGGAIFSVTPVTEETARAQSGFYAQPACLALPSLDDDDEPF